MTTLSGKSKGAGRFDLTGRIALVTGGSRGIGRAIATELGEAGADVVVHYATNATAAADVVQRIEAAGRRSKAIAADFTRTGSGTALANLAVSVFQRIDILVLNAARGIRQRFTEVPADALANQVNANFLAGFEIMQVCLPRMAERRWGRVVTIGSVQQVRPNPALSVYAAMKSAQFNLVTNLARQYSKDGVTINNIAPGLIETDQTAAQLGDSRTLDALLDEIPTRSVGYPSDCVGPVLLLCSDAGRYITGVNLFVDGGMHLPGRARYIGADGRTEQT